MRGIWVGLLVLLQGTRAFGQEPICTDRPGKSTSTCTVPKGHWQVETSFADWSLVDSGGVRSTSLAIGSTALKYGVSDDMHVEVAAAPYVRNRDRSEAWRMTESGFGDVTVTVKRRLTAPDASFSAALVPFVKLPTASRRLGNGKVEAGLIIPLEWSLGDTPWSLSSSPELDLVADADGRGYHKAAATTFGVALDATEALAVAAELWTAWEWDEGRTTRQTSLGANAAYKLTSNVQVDGQVDFGLTRDSADVEISGGIAVRFK